jgi:hypothetical protein
LPLTHFAADPTRDRQRLPHAQLQQAVKSCRRTATHCRN